jgi:hypothetical protein
MFLLLIFNAGNSIVISENLTDLSSPAAFADKAMRGLSAKQVMPLQFQLPSRSHRLAAGIVARRERSQQLCLSHDDRHSAQVISLSAP